jgi:NAD(P)-dependent dehydrogenase (short-subunit alcohol dehydrogenase family)
MQLLELKNLPNCQVRNALRAFPYKRQAHMTAKKIALVTGVSRGIGRAIAVQLLSDGFSVAGTYNSNKAEAQSLLEKTDDLELFQCDFSKRSETLALIEKLSNYSFDLLVNNAGIFCFENPNSLDADIWDKTIEINVTAAMLLATKLMPRMPEGSTIVNISSTDSFTGSFNSIAYAASKAALNSLTKSLANIGGARKVRVVAIAPGWINNTGMNSPVSQEAAMLSSLGRNGEPGEIADLVSFLASSKAGFITGTTIVADGGYTCVDYIMKTEAEA